MGSVAPMSHPTSSTPKIAVTDWTFADLKLEEKIASEAGFELDARQCRSSEELTALCAEADAVITQFAKLDAAVIDAMSKARVIVRYGIGVDNVDLEAARRRKIPVCNIPEYCVDEVADHTLAFILAMARQVVPNAVHIRAGAWGMATPLESMAAMKDLTVGIIGFGRIGREVVRRLSPFKCRILVFDPVATKEAITSAGAGPAGSLDELLRASDIVSPHHLASDSTK
ncbi:MAG: NAD(P)-dependent oxidoreductase, partial [Spartobacteria bacterium]